jgi:hypothetical protein
MCLDPGDFNLQLVDDAARVSEAIKSAEQDAKLVFCKSVCFSHRAGAQEATPASG